MASTWSSGDWNLGTWNNAFSGAVLTGQELSTSVETITVDADIRSGWGMSGMQDLMQESL